MTMPAKTAVTPKVANLAVDCADLDVMAVFWGELLGLQVISRDEDWLDLGPLGPNGPLLSFQRVPERKTIKNRLHLDIEVPDIRAAGERAEKLGATPAGELLGNPKTPFQVWYDPEGNEFCLCTEA